METISILGCGWLGLPLGQRLATQGHRVKGSTTTPDKLDVVEAAGIEPYLLRLDPEPTSDSDDFFQSDILFVNVPPPRNRDDASSFHERQMEMISAATTADWVILASSTGVYPNADRVVTEEDVPPGGPPAYEGSRRSTGQILETVEGMWATKDVDVTVLRFGGLYGPKRHPGRFLAGKSGLARPSAPVNLIHLDDCIGIAEAVIQEGARGAIFNAVADQHPSRRETYTRAARSLGLKTPDFDMSDERGGKVVSNEKVRAELGYAFAHPDPSDV
ncbi:NAD(P)-dependent oxidoreductase [Longibacter salinarum]|uniref:NAD(P)-dependent oxidoreductase n=1 Tax=Longibacter salinarum TaxID=1850348 RepID=A0A2A8D1S5_9BACT|nr:SDR family oxidoreductase [Longibacter salinarum]PEN14598.1 NAD(P)-dependent oxidoreductase [Longibacter salinarum]